MARCSPRGNPACRGTFGGRRKAVIAAAASGESGRVSAPPLPVPPPGAGAGCEGPRLAAAGRLGHGVGLKGGVLAKMSFFSESRCQQLSLAGFSFAKSS